LQKARKSPENLQSVTMMPLAKRKPQSWLKNLRYQ